MNEPVVTSPVKFTPNFLFKEGNWLRIGSKIRTQYWYHGTDFPISDPFVLRETIGKNIDALMPDGIKWRLESGALITSYLVKNWEGITYASAGIEIEVQGWQTRVLLSKDYLTITREQIADELRYLNSLPEWIIQTVIGRLAGELTREEFEE